MAMVIPPTFLPMFVTGYLVVRNMGRRRNQKRHGPYRGPARMSTSSTRARRSSPGGMDGERISPRGWQHPANASFTTNPHNRACITR